MPSRLSAAIPFCRTATCDLELLLVTSRRKRRWVIPKGNVRGKLPHASAAREAFEEAGVLGVISSQQAGFYHQTKLDGAGSKREIVVAAYPLFVNTLLHSWPEMALRNRRWLSAADAVALVEDAGLRALLARFARDYETHDPPL
nr:NUDIX hydrolase [Novosphingobium panipatense]